MGKFSEPLAVLFAGEAGVRPGQRALDVGCGPGALRLSSRSTSRPRGCARSTLAAAGTGPVTVTASAWTAVARP